MKKFFLRVIEWLNADDEPYYIGSRRRFLVFFIAFIMLAVSIFLITPFGNAMIIIGLFWLVVIVFMLLI